MEAFSPEKMQEFYQALLRKDVHYEGVFYVGVKTTGIFCRPTCPARKPNYENCLFFHSAQEALLASFRPCQRCKPLSHPQEVSETVRKLVAAIEAEPEKRWKESDFQALSIDASTARRQFKKRFGMTFVEYARARRMGLAMDQIRNGKAVIDVQLNTGYESSSGFRDAFSKIMGAPPSQSDGHYRVLQTAWIDTTLGPMLAIADEKGLYLLEFICRRGLEREIEKLRHTMRAALVPGTTEPLAMVEEELKAYFDGTLRSFQTPIHLLGTPFQKQAWEMLQRIPYGETRSYKEQAVSLGNPKAYRAVARANGTNQLALLIPCHRIINSDGTLGGYGGGVHCKKWLLQHESTHRFS